MVNGDIALRLRLKVLENTLALVTTVIQGFVLFRDLKSTAITEENDKCGIKEPWIPCQIGGSLYCDARWKGPVRVIDV